MESKTIDNSFSVIGNEEFATGLVYDEVPRTDNFSRTPTSFYATTEMCERIFIDDMQQIVVRTHVQNQ